MKLWEKRFAERIEFPLLEEFNSSIKVDRFLYWAEIEASTAYIKALHKASRVTRDECKKTVAGLKKVKKRIEEGEDLSRFEDIHSAVELILTEEIGECGKKLHTGRSRNEQVVTIERLYLKNRIPCIVKSLEQIQAVIIKLAEENFDIIMPGYTHLQQAQCVLFSHYIMSLFWQMERGKRRLKNILKILDVSPLGVGAISGSSVPLDREYIRKTLGFSSITENSMDTVSDRSFILDTLFALSLILLDLSRFTEDLVIFSSNEFGYMEIDDCILTSSSLMPQKRNPDFFELIRAGSGQVFGYMSSLFITIKGLPSTYNKDLQTDKGPLYLGVEETIKVLEVFHLILNKIKPVKEKILRNMSSFILSTDLVDYLVLKGIPFRDAHGIVCGIVNYAQQKNKEIDQLCLEEFRRYSNLFNEDIFKVFNFEASIRGKKTQGSTHPEFVRQQIKKAKNLIEQSL